MSTIFSSISSNFFKKSIPLYASISINPIPFLTVPKQKVAIAQYGTQTCSLASFRVVGLAHDPTYVPGKSPPEIPTAPPEHKPGVPPEVPRRPNVPDFDPIPPEKPADPPPPSPGPNPEFPSPPDPIPRKPNVPPPQIRSPPHGPDVTPPKPPEPGPPNPTQPDIAPPIMGSDGLVFYL